MVLNLALIRELFTRLVAIIPRVEFAESQTKVAIRTIMGNLQNAQVLLEQKALELVLASNKTHSQCRAERQNFLTCIIKQRKVIENINKACISYLERHQDSFPKETYEEKMRDLTRRQNLLFSGDVALARQQDRIFAEVDDIIIESYEIEPSRRKDYLIEYFYCLSTKKIGGGESRDGQARWTRFVSKHYGLIDHERRRVWSPITKRTESIEVMRAVHVVSSKIGYRTMAHLFDDDDGHSLMWSTGNSLPMERPLARSFDELNFCLVPHDAAPGKPNEWKLVLMNESIRHESIPYFSRTWNEYDGTVLQFQEGCDIRPEAKFLFFHYLMCLVKAQRENTPAAWQQLMEKFKAGELWTVPGPYLRRSMAEKFVSCLGDHFAPQQEALMKYTFEGENILDGDEEDVSVKDLFSAFIPKYGPEEDSDDENEDDNEGYR